MGFVDNIHQLNKIRALGQYDPLVQLDLRLTFRCTALTLDRLICTVHIAHVDRHMYTHHNADCLFGYMEGNLIKSTVLVNSYLLYYHVYTYKLIKC